MPSSPRIPRCSHRPKPVYVQAIARTLTRAFSIFEDSGNDARYELADTHTAAEAYTRKKGSREGREPQGAPVVAATKGARAISHGSLVKPARAIGIRSRTRLRTREREREPCTREREREPCTRGRERESTLRIIGAERDRESPPPLTVSSSPHHPLATISGLYSVAPDRAASHPISAAGRRVRPSDQQQRPQRRRRASASQQRASSEPAVLPRRQASNIDSRPRVGQRARSK